MKFSDNFVFFDIQNNTFKIFHLTKQTHTGVFVLIYKIRYANMQTTLNKQKSEYIMHIYKELNY